MKPEYNNRLSLALDLLASKGVRDGNATPPMWRLLRRLGLRFPPPYFCGFLPVFLSYGMLFGAGFWIVNMALVHRLNPPLAAPSWALVSLGGLVFGLFMALRGLYVRRRYNLPRWQELR